MYKVRQYLVNTVGLTCLYELRLQSELPLQTQLIRTSQLNHAHKVLPDLVEVLKKSDVATAQRRVKEEVDDGYLS